MSVGMYKQEEEEEETQPLDLWIYCIIAIITGNPPHVCGDGVLTHACGPLVNFG